MDACRHDGAFPRVRIPRGPARVRRPTPRDPIALGSVALSTTAKGQRDCDGHVTESLRAHEQTGRFPRAGRVAEENLAVRGHEEGVLLDSRALRTELGRRQMP